MPDNLRALHYYIMCLNHEMIELKEKVIQTLAIGEELLFTKFLRNNPEFRRIPPEDRI